MVTEETFCRLLSTAVFGLQASKPDMPKKSIDELKSLSKDDLYREVLKRGYVITVTYTFMDGLPSFSFYKVETDQQMGVCQ